MTFVSVEKSVGDSLIFFAMNPCLSFDTKINGLHLQGETPKTGIST